jgi:hypothetical protein
MADDGERAVTVVPPVSVRGDHDPLGVVPRALRLQRTDADVPRA